MKKMLLLLMFLIIGALSFSYKCMITKYIIIDNKVYYIGQSEDKTVYYSEKEPLLIKGADIKTIESIGMIGFDCNMYYKDKNRVYYMDKGLLDAEPNTFDYVGYDFITKDRNHVYYKSIKLENLDAKTFELVSREWISQCYDEIFKDKNGKYTNKDIEKMAEKINGIYKNNENSTTFCQKGV